MTDPLTDRLREAAQVLHANFNPHFLGFYIDSCKVCGHTFHGEIQHALDCPWPEFETALAAPPVVVDEFPTGSVPCPDCGGYYKFSGPGAPCAWHRPIIAPAPSVGPSDEEIARWADRETIEILAHPEMRKQSAFRLAASARSLFSVGATPEDTKRLDWLETLVWLDLWSRPATASEPGVYAGISAEGLEETKRATLREAIDAARLSHESEEK